jgi:hypothetical protein
MKLQLLIVLLALFALVRADEAEVTAAPILVDDGTVVGGIPPQAPYVDLNGIRAGAEAPLEDVFVGKTQTNEPIVLSDAADTTPPTYIL